MRGTTPKMMLIAAAAALAPSCASKERVRPIFPSSADLTVEEEPAVPAEMLSDDELVAREAEDRFDDSILQWGRRGWRQVARVCRWADDHGMAGLDCPEAR